MKHCPSCQSTFPTNYTHCPRDGNPLAEAGEWAEGTLVRGKYQILAKVGQGGMAAVYKALHVRFNEPRALKVINPELANDATFVKRFEQEAIITRRLQHPNAVRVEDIDEAEDGRPFIVMEYVEGGNLKAVIERESPMSVARVCEIVKQIAAALDAAHALGLVHRDIKPANIALLASSDMGERSSDRVKVLDFGIAKLKEAHLEESKAHPLAHMTLTGTGMVIGTPAYMSPEQAKGLKGAELDGRSDLYSLGVVMYQMLTGDLPLKADSTLELLMAHISTPPKPIQEGRPDLQIPDSVAAVVMRCLEKNRELRPARGQALIEEIEFAGSRASVLPVRPAVAMTPTRNHVAPKPIVESPAVARRSGVLHSRLWSWAVTAILLASTLGGAWYLRGRKPPVAQESQRIASTTTETKPVITPPVEGWLAPAPARQPPATRSIGPTSGAAQAVRSIKTPEAAAKSPEPTSTAEHYPMQAGATDTPIAALKDLAPKPSTPTPTAIAVSPSVDAARINEKAPAAAASSELEATRSFEEAQAALSAKKYEEAAALFGRAARLKPGWSDPLAWKAQVDAKLGRFLETIEDCDEALRLNPNDAKVLNFRGFARSSLNRYDEAVSDFNAAIRINPDYYDAYRNRGNVRWALRDKEGAKRDFDAAARLQSAKR
jgi:serine/threonine protein kinase/Flp pilus assembly protein TadD